MSDRRLPPDILQYVKQISSISDIMLHRLARMDRVGLSELKDILEDTGNHFLQVAHQIRDTTISNDQAISGTEPSLKVIVGGA